MSKEENITAIVAKETVGTDSSGNFLKNLENYEIRQQKELDEIAQTFKSSLTGLTETLLDIFKQRNSMPGSHNQDQEFKLVLTPGLMPRVLYKKKTIILSGLMPSRASDILIPLIIMKFQMIASASKTRAILMLRLLRWLLTEILTIKIDLAGKISNESKALTESFLDQLLARFGRG